MGGVIHHTRVFIVGAVRGLKGSAPLRGRTGKSCSRQCVSTDDNTDGQCETVQLTLQGGKKLHRLRHRQATRATQATDTADADAGVIQTTVHVHRSISASGCRLAKGHRAERCGLVQTGLDPVTKAEMRVGRLGTWLPLTGFCTFRTAPPPSRVRHFKIGLILQRWSCPRR